MSGERSLWASILRSRYGSLLSRVVRGGDMMKWPLWWKDLVELWSSRAGSLFTDKLVFKLGNGQSVNFWSDPWVKSKVRLKEVFPQKSESVRGCFLGDGLYWIFKWE